MICECGCTCFLGSDRDGSEIVAIADVGSVQQIDGEDTVEQLSDAQILAVIQLDEYRGCPRCKARVEPQVYPFSRCSQAGCEMMQQSDECTEAISAVVMYSCLSMRLGDLVKQLANVPPDAVVKEADCRFDDGSTVPRAPQK